MSVGRAWLLAGVVLWAGPLRAQDAFPLVSAQIVHAPDVTAWPQTATITRLTFGNGQTSVDFTKKNGPGRWPDIRPAGWDGDIQYTLWLCLQTPQWTCSAFIEFWNSRPASGSPADPDVPSRYHANWYYAERWSPLFGHGPIKPGESIAFLVTSGDARDSKGPYGPSERSNVVVVQATDNGDFAFAAQPPPVVVPPPVVMPPPVQPPPPVVVVPPVTVPPIDFAAAVRQVLNEELLPLERDTNTKTTAIHAQVRSFTQQFGSVMMWLSKYVAPAVGAAVLAWQMKQTDPAPATTGAK